MPEATRDSHDINEAWRFVADSFDPYSPDRCGWTDEDIFGFVAEHHITGLDSFVKG